MRTFLLLLFVTFGTLQIQSQTKIISGIVSDDTGSLVGVNVRIKGEAKVTVTDFDGKYSIEVYVGDILEYSFIGMKTESRTIGLSNIINVKMSEDQNVLETVVVCGFGHKVEKRSSTFSVQSVGGESLPKSRKRNVVNSLSGKITGVQVKSSSGSVGSSSKIVNRKSNSKPLIVKSRYNQNGNNRIVLRGASSLTGNNQPLYVIDGIPFNHVNQNQVNSIKPKDIKKINVLKGPAAAAIYGVRASNGVIEITTKKGNYKLPKFDIKQEIITDESYEDIIENNFERTQSVPLSTFSIDVDKASYSNIRRMINNGQKVPEDAVKIEEMINYFNFDYKQPKGEVPFSINTEYSTCAWNEKHKLVKIGLQGKIIPTDKIPPTNLVFLIDVSGSMRAQNKLPLLKSSFELLVNQLREKDKVSIVVYAGAAGVVLNPTNGNNKQKILEALNNLEAGGSTAGGEGIELAYKIAQENFIKKGNNRIVLATDGDFNVGMSSDKSMEKLIEEKRKSGVFLTTLGFGMGNYKDSKLETLADKGNGNHAYIDSMQEANKVLGSEFGGTIFTIAKDVKIQVEFNPKKVQAYRLIGYENRMLESEDFQDDTKDAGELGSGHKVTALYELIPVGLDSKFLKGIDKLKYTKTDMNESYSDELLTVKFRYKKPNSNKSKEIVYPLIEKEISIDNTSEDFQFASSVALFGMKIRGSKYAKKSNYDDVISLAENGRGVDKDGYRAEFIRLVKSYK